MNSPPTTCSACGLCCTRIEDFSVTLGQSAIVEHINLHIHCGELTALIGPNGAGKTTLLRAIIGELPHTGQVRFIHAQNKGRHSAPRIGYVPQRFEIDTTSPISVLDLLAAAGSRRPVWAGISGRFRARALGQLALVETQDLAEQKLGRLSWGQIQRVLLALALDPLPDLLLLDEPVSGVDRAGIGLFYRMVSRLRLRYDLSIILVSHDLNEIAGLADRMLFLNRSILCDGTPAEALANPIVRKTFGMDIAPDSIKPSADVTARRERGAAARDFHEKGGG